MKWNNVDKGHKLWWNQYGDLYIFINQWTDKNRWQIQISNDKEIIVVITLPIY